MIRSAPVQCYNEFSAEIFLRKPGFFPIVIIKVKVCFTSVCRFALDKVYKFKVHIFFEMFVQI